MTTCQRLIQTTLDAIESREREARNLRVALRTLQTLDAKEEWSDEEQRGYDRTAQWIFSTLRGDTGSDVFNARNATLREVDPDQK